MTLPIAAQGNAPGLRSARPSQALNGRQSQSLYFAPSGLANMYVRYSQGVAPGFIIAAFQAGNSLGNVVKDKRLSFERQ